MGTKETKEIIDDMSNLEKAQKAFAFFISSTTNEGAVAFDKLRQLGVSLDDVAYQNVDGSWLTRWGSIQFDMGSGSGNSANLERQQRTERPERESQQRAESERQRQEQERREHEADREARRWSREYDQNRKREQEAEHKHYADIVARQREQAENHEAFNRGEGYIGSDGQYHLFSDMKWSH